MCVKTLETSRLILRPWNLKDLDDLYEYASMEDVGIHAGWLKHDSIEVSQQILQNFIQSHCEYAIVLKDINKTIGSIGIKNEILEKYKDLDQRAIGYCLSKDYWGQGIMTEAVNRIHQYLFDDVGVDLLWIEHFKGNDRSSRVIIKTGYHYEEDAIFDAVQLDKKIECKRYVMFKEDYLKIKGLRKEFPILEFDPNPNAFINPSIVEEDSKPLSKNLVVCFFQDVLRALLAEGIIELYEMISGENPCPVYRFKDYDCMIMQGAVGGAACGGDLEETIQLGARNIMFCGGAGSLHKDITVGKIVLVDSAIRDEGLSYHYMAPSREVRCNDRVLSFVENQLKEREVSYIKGKVWTTDAFYRETKDKIALRNNENCLMVEMEQAGLFAVTNFRNVNYAALIYGGDDLTSDKWDQRGWKNRSDVRRDLLFLCKDIVLEIDKCYKE